jgi:hypothetical protein
MLSTRLYFIISRFQIQATCCSKGSEIATCPATAGATSSEASEATTVVIAATTATASSAKAAAHQISEKEEDQARVAGFDEEEKDQQYDSATEHDLGQRKLDRRLLLAVVLMDGLLSEGNASVGRDDPRDLAHT